MILGKNDQVPILKKTVFLSRVQNTCCGHSKEQSRDTVSVTLSLSDYKSTISYDLVKPHLFCVCIAYN